MRKINIQENVPISMNPEEPDSAFLEVFGGSPILRILDFLVIYENFDYRLRDIARLSNMNYSTLKLLWPKLEEQGIVKHTHKTGSEKRYQLDLKNPIARRFREFYWEVTKREVRQFLEEGKKVKAKSKKEKIEVMA